MKKRLIHAAAAGLLTAASAMNVQAQDAADALRFSFLQPQGTARSISFGNALGSVGGDFTSLSVNPAGIGIYRKSEFMISPSLMFNSVDGRPNNAGGFGGNANTDNGQHFSLSNLGLVLTHNKHGRRRYNSGGWQTGSFALGLNRLADFTRDYSYSGTNTSTSASWVFESDANSYGLDEKFQPGGPADIGYQSYLLDTATLSNGQAGYHSVVSPSFASPVNQRTTVRERGGANEFLMSFGGNYEDKLMLGATIGVPYIRYTQDKTIDENDLSGNPDNNFDYFTYNEYRRTTGIGINAKLGFIYKPVDIFRIGAAIHTPTAYSFHDYTETSIAANTENFGGYRSYQGANREYDYNLTTPWRAVASATALFGKYGFVTFDYEYVDYASSRFNLNSDDRNYERYVNDAIKSSYKSASNLRAGLELRFDILSLRGGVGYYGDPYKESMANYVNGERWDFSGGIGFRLNRTFIDLGYIHHEYKNTDQPYVLSYSNYISPTARLSTMQDNAVLTVGWKF